MFWLFKCCYWDITSLSNFQRFSFHQKIPLVLKHYWGECNCALMSKTAHDYFVVPQDRLSIVVLQNKSDCFIFKVIGVWIKTIFWVSTNKLFSNTPSVITKIENIYGQWLKFFKIFQVDIFCEYFNIYLPVLKEFRVNILLVIFFTMFWI